jgi:hypothetical protein
MELHKFKKKCDKYTGSEERVYCVLFDKYHYYECYKKYSELKDIVKAITDIKRATYMKPEEICIKESEFYLTHLDNIYKLKQIGYTQIQ